MSEEALSKRIQQLLVDTFETSWETAELVASEIMTMIKGGDQGEEGRVASRRMP